MEIKKGLDIPPYIISFRVVRFKLSDSSFETVGLSHFHAKRPDCILQEIFARLTMYNFSELISMPVVIERSGNKYAFRANFSAAAHICRHFFLGRVAPADLEADAVVFTTPVCWYSIPARMKGVIDRLFVLEEGDGNLMGQIKLSRIVWQINGSRRVRYSR